MSREALEMALEAIDKRFRSGNKIPVERATVLASEWAALRSALAEKREPVCGANYEAGLWSRRNYEAWMEDQMDAAARGMAVVAYTTMLAAAQEGKP